MCINCNESLSCTPWIQSHRWASRAHAHNRAAASAVVHVVNRTVHGSRPSPMILKPMSLNNDASIGFTWHAEEEVVMVAVLEGLNVLPLVGS